MIKNNQTIKTTHGNGLVTTGKKKIALLCYHDADYHEKTTMLDYSSVLNTHLKMKTSNVVMLDVARK
jgi:hypothetical protein